MKFRTPRAHYGNFLRFIRELPCLICGDDTATEAAHIRYADLAAGKRSTGMGEKPDDAFVVPLCGGCHRQQHTTNERKWWALNGVDPVKVALALWYWYCRDNRDTALIVVNNTRAEMTD
jgi:hypothetical protein